MSKSGNPTDKRQVKVFKKYLKLLSIDYERRGNHGDIYRHPEKNITIQMPVNPSSPRWVHNKKNELCKVAKENWSTDELVILLEPLVKKKKVEFLKDGKPKLLRKGVDFTQYKGAFNIGGIKGGGTNKRRIMKKKIQEAFDLIELDNQIMKGILGE